MGLTNKPKKVATTPVEPLAGAVRFVDFSVRAWREGPYVQVMAHSTPAGAMRQPAAVKIGSFVGCRLPRSPSMRLLAVGAETGRKLARILLPPGSLAAARRKPRRLSDRPPCLGLRLRLCLDDDLIDLPWEFLYRPDVHGTGGTKRVLSHRRPHLADARAAVNRRACSRPMSRRQRALFLGTMWDDGSDGWAVKSEYASLERAMQPVGGLMKFAFTRSDDFGAVEKALARGCQVFHYAGHTDIANGRGTLVHLVRAEDISRARSTRSARTTPRVLDTAGETEAVARPAEWADSEVLAPMLARANTRLAVFNACNSGLWPFVRPLMRTGIPAVIGIQGLVSNIAALNFAEKLYQSLAVGLSLDEALTYARLYVMQPGRSYHPCDWARFMAYMPVDSAVLFPRPAMALDAQASECRAPWNGAHALDATQAATKGARWRTSRQNAVRNRQPQRPDSGSLHEGSQAGARLDSPRPVDDAARLRAHPLRFRSSHRSDDDRVGDALRRGFPLRDRRSFFF